jgi:MFS family permease
VECVDSGNGLQIINATLNVPSTRGPPSDTSNATSSGGSGEKPGGKPANIPWMALPNKSQLFLLAVCRLSEPLSNTCLLPYIYYLMRYTVSRATAAAAAGESLTDGEDADERLSRQISEMSGFLVAAFPMAQCLTSMLWARVADKYGRRTVILAGLVGSAVANLAFGFSRTFWGLMFWRVIAGIANGNIGVMRTMTAEIVVERKYQTKAFLLLPLVFNSGMIFGLALGGLLADPVTNMPWAFGAQGFFNFFAAPDGVQWAVDYPYALPAIFNAVVLAGTLAMAVGGLRETLPGLEGATDIGLKCGYLVTRWVKQLVTRKKKDYGYSALALDDMEDAPMLHRNTSDSRPPKPMGPPSKMSGPVGKPSFSSVCTRDVVCALISFGLLPLHNSAFMHLFPVFLSNPPRDNPEWTLMSFKFTGGLGLASPSIGLWLGFFGICGILLQLFIYPRMQARIGTLGNLRVALYLFPFAYFLAPYLVLIPATGSVLRYLSIGIVAWAQIMARTLAIPSTVILLTNAAPEKRMLSTIHGAGNMLSSLARAIGPSLGGFIAAWGTERGMGGAVWWFYLEIIALIALVWSYTMKPSD